MANTSLHIDPNAVPVMDDDLIGLVTSRICHDLVSPIGAIDNGIELMTVISGTTHSAEMGLIGESARAAGIKLRMFRIAFGVAPATATCRGTELREVFEHSFSRPRLSFAWPDAAQDLPRPTAKLAALALLCADSAMPFGGQLRFQATQDGLRITMATERLRWQQELWDGLTETGNFGDVGAGQVQFPMARLLATQLGRTFTLSDQAEGKVLLV